MSNSQFITFLTAAILCFTGNAGFINTVQAEDRLFDVEFNIPAKWNYSKPLILPEDRKENRSHAQKDPTIVFAEGTWHVFMTIKLQSRSIIEYCFFKDWNNANTAKRHVLNLRDGNYWCAPQVFYFTPHKKWYLVYQVGVPGLKKMWVAYSTTNDISDPTSWTKAKPMLDGGTNDSRKVGGIDYWIICDDKTAYLFFTSNNGKMWRMKTSLDKFPNGFDDCQLVLQAKIFEACHIYKVKGTSQYINVIEENGRRYFKAYVANRLDGAWLPIADSAENPFAGWKNVRPSTDVKPWTDNISHGELVRAGFDEKLEVDPMNWQFVFQGCFDEEKRGKGYGQWPWRIGVLTPFDAEGIGSR